MIPRVPAPAAWTGTSASPTMILIFSRPARHDRQLRYQGQRCLDQFDPDRVSDGDGRQRRAGRSPAGQRRHRSRSSRITDLQRPIHQPATARSLSPTPICPIRISVSVALDSAVWSADPFFVPWPRGRSADRADDRAARFHRSRHRWRRLDLQHCGQGSRLPGPGRNLDGDLRRHGLGRHRQFDPDGDDHHDGSG